MNQIYKNILVIYNPNAGPKYVFNKEKELKKYLNKFNVTFLISDNLIDNSEIIKSFNNIDVVIIAGGDGTLRRGVNYLIKNGIDLPILFYPIGTANIYARIIGLPLIKKKILTNIQDFNILEMPVGIINNNEYFLIAACFGKAAEISTRADYFFKNIIGFFSYIVAFFKILSRYQLKKVSITDDSGFTKQYEAHSVLVFLSKCLNGYMPILYHTSKKYQVFILKNRTFNEITKAMKDIFINNTMSPHIEILNVDYLNIDARNFENKHLDGDAIKDKGVNDYHFEVLEKNIRFIV